YDRAVKSGDRAALILLAGSTARQGREMTDDRHLIHIENGNAVFNLRVVAVFVDGEYVLVHRAEPDDFWTLPGGRAEFGESTREAAAREMREELKVEAEVGKLLWVVEYFFDTPGRAYQEVDFYYRMRFPSGTNVTPATPSFHGDDMGMPLIFRWVRLDELAGLRLYPTFLKTALWELPETTQHVILREED
ncbi:MAG TPA: NUDIX hydrolase, partial [Chloroflexia bacterium]